jgi:Cyclic phosphodiesterase-like protein
MNPSYHLWLKPSGQAYDVLADVIRELSHKLQAPTFEPHVTLLGNLSGSEHEHLHRTKQLAPQLQPLPITLTAPSHGNEYFQCLFIKVEQTEQIMSANASARCVFGHGGGGAYMPHMSLVYGLYPEALKRELIATLSAHLRMTFEATLLHLIRADSDDPKDWHEVAVVPMGRGTSMRDEERKK